MYCLYNGEYGEHNLNHIGGIDKICKNQKESYKNYIGLSVGDFRVLKVEYDWGKRTQRWEVECMFCHEKSYIYNGHDWKRGKGKSIFCKCRKRGTEPIVPDFSLADIVHYTSPTFVGMIISEWRIVKYVPSNHFQVECVICGHKKKVTCASLIRNRVPSCDHRKTNDYSEEKWLGQRNGHLVTLSYEDGLFISRCDCGRVVKVRGQDLFRRKSKTSCQCPGCAYYQESVRDVESQKRRKIGLDYEHSARELFEQNGYEIERTPDSGDYGVDFIVKDYGGRIAIQCKMQKSPAGVKSVQEVYAGGRYYDCERFAVISPSGFSINAIRIASKLGVYLAQHEFLYPKNISEHSAKMLDTLPPVDNRASTRKTVWTIDGVTKSADEWCRQHQIARTTVEARLSQGMELKQALKLPKYRAKTYEVLGFKGTLQEISNHFDIIPQTIRYRMNHRGMSIEEAVLCSVKKGQNHRGTRL